MMNICLVAAAQQLQRLQGSGQESPAMLLALDFVDGVAGVFEGKLVRISDSFSNPQTVLKGSNGLFLLSQVHVCTAKIIIGRL